MLSGDLVNLGPGVRIGRRRVEQTPMAEKPILKKDRDNSDRGPAESTAENSSNQRPQSKGRGKGKGRDQNKAPKTPANPALMRGPKPVKKSPEPDAPPEEVVEAAADEAADTDVAADQVVEPSPEDDASA